MGAEKNTYSYLEPIIWKVKDKHEAKEALLMAFAETLFVDWARPQFLVFDEDYNIVWAWWWIDFDWKNLDSLESFLKDINIDTFTISSIISEMNVMTDWGAKDSVRLINSADWKSSYSIIFRRRALDESSWDERWIMQSTIWEASYIFNLYEEYKRIAGNFVSSLLSEWFTWDESDNLDKLRELTLELEQEDDFEEVKVRLAEIKNLVYGIYNISSQNALETVNIPNFAQKSVERPVDTKKWSDTEDLIDRILSWEEKLSDEIISQMIEIRKFVSNAIPTFIIAPSWIDWSIIVLNNEHKWVYENFEEFMSSFQYDGKILDTKKVKLLFGLEWWDSNALLWDVPFTIATKFADTENGRQFTLTPNKDFVSDPLSKNRFLLSMSESLMATIDSICCKEDIDNVSDLIIQLTSNIRALISNLLDISEGQSLDEIDQNPSLDIFAFKKYLSVMWFKWSCDINIWDNTDLIYGWSIFSLFNVLVSLQNWNFYNWISDIEMNVSNDQSCIKVDLLFSWNDFDQENISLLRKKLINGDRDLSIWDNLKIYNDILEAMSWIKWWEIDVKKTDKGVVFNIIMKSV